MIAQGEEAGGGKGPQGFFRGRCEDLVETYTCDCGQGYHLATMGYLPSNRTCIPTVCGSAPEVEYPIYTLCPNQVNYGAPAWNYSCAQGHTTNGEASGAGSAEAHCTRTGPLLNFT